MIREYSMELAANLDVVFAAEGDRWWSDFVRDSGEWIGKAGLPSKAVEGVTEIELCDFLLPATWRLGYASEAAAHLPFMR